MGPGDASPLLDASSSCLLKYCLGAPAPTADVGKVNDGAVTNLALYWLPNEEPLLRRAGSGGGRRGGAKAMIFV